MKLSIILAFLAVGVIASKVDDNGVNRPVNKVIALLKQMTSQLEAEQKEDEEVYDKLDCWCETNDKAKTKSIAEAEARIEQLTSQIEELTATASRLNQEIENLAKEIEANEQALAKATAIREKEHNEFAAEERDMLEAIASLKAAILVLSKHHAPPAEALLHIAAMVKFQVHKHKDILGSVLTHKTQHAIGAFVQGDFFGKAPAFKQAYAPGSGEVFGILRDMKDQFEYNLSEAQKEEAAAQAAFEELRAAKEAEIAAGKAQLDSKKSELAQTEEDLAQAKQDLSDTQESLSGDQKFLADLKEKCTQTDAEWAERQKTRQEEMQAVSQALSILTSDEAHDVFVRTFNPSFVEESTMRKGALRHQASVVLRLAAKHSKDTRLLQLATDVELDAFTRVKKAIDDMVAMLLKEQVDEQKHRDWCIDERNMNDRTTEQRQRDKSDLEALIEQLTHKIDALIAEIAQLTAEIKDAQIQIKRAGEDREAENREFRSTVTDQRQTQGVLQRALDVLNAFYNHGAALVQEGSKQAPPPGFSEYSKNRASGGVVKLITQIMGEARQMETETVQAEQDSQAAYETFVKDTNALIADKQRQITDATEDKAKAEGDRTEAQQDHAAVMTELEELAAYSANLHASCDFIVHNFDIRQTARAQEVEALRQAKAILSGSGAVVTSRSQR